MEFLRDNADAFLRNAEKLLEDSEFKLVAFNSEQAVQLYLKYLISSKLGDFPKTYSLKKLFRDTGSLCPKLFKLFEENTPLIGDMEFAYIGARCLPTEYTESEVRQMIQLALKVREIVNECLHRTP